MKVCVSGCPHPSLSVSLPAHGEQDQALRVFEADLPRRDRRPREDRRAGGDQLPSDHGDNPSVSADHGEWLRAEQDSGHLHPAEDPPR